MPVLHLRTDGVSDAIERCEFLFRKFPGAFDDRLNHIRRGIGKAIMAGQFIDVGNMLQDKQLLAGGGGEHGARCFHYKMASLL